MLLRCNSHVTVLELRECVVEYAILDVTSALVTICELKTVRGAAGGRTKRQLQKISGPRTKVNGFCLNCLWCHSNV